MRALLLPFLFALLAALPAKVLAADGNDGIRQFVNGSWQLKFEDSGTRENGEPYKLSTIITITMRYDGTRTITQDEYVNDAQPIRTAAIDDVYRVDDIDGTNFTLTSWTDTQAPKVTNRKRTGADTMTAEGSDSVYQRVAGTQEAVPATLPPQREPPAPATQEARDAAIRTYMVGRWTASLTKDGQTIVSVFDYSASGQLSGTQSVTANGRTQNYSVKGSYTVAATGDQSFTLTLNVPGIAPVSTGLQIVDQNTLFNPVENYRATRTP